MESRPSRHGAMRYVLLGIMLAAAATGCAGGGSSSLLQPATSVATHTATSGKIKLHHPRFSMAAYAKAKARMATNAPPSTKITSATTRRAPSDVVNAYNEVEEAGIQFPSTDANGNPYEQLEWLAVVDASFELPTPPNPGAYNTLIGSDTVVGSNSCLEIMVVYQKDSIPADDTTRQIVMNDLCDGVQTVLATIDSTFMSTYTASATYGPEVQIDVVTDGTVPWMVEFTQPGNTNTSGFGAGSTLASSSTGGQSTMTINTFVPGEACPSDLDLPNGVYAQASEQFTEFEGAGGINPTDLSGTLLGPTIVPTPAASAVPDCYQNTYSTTGKYNLLYSNDEWNVAWSAGHATPAPLSLPTGYASTVGSGLDVTSFAVPSSGNPFISQITGTNTDGSYNISQGAINASTSSVTSYESLSEVTQIDDAVGPDGDVWSVVAYYSGSTEVRRYSTSGLDSNFSLGGRYGHVVAGSDSRGWFVSAGADLGVITGSCTVSATTNTGTITDYTTPCFHYDLTPSATGGFFASSPSTDNSQSTYVYAMTTSGTTTQLANLPFYGQSVHAYNDGNIYSAEVGKSGLAIVSKLDPTYGTQTYTFQPSRANEYSWEFAGGAYELNYYLYTPSSGNSLLCRFNVASTSSSNEKCYSLGASIAQVSSVVAENNPSVGFNVMQAGPGSTLWLNATTYLYDFNLANFPHT